jgi:hypothetical protein
MGVGRGGHVYRALLRPNPNKDWLSKQPTEVKISGRGNFKFPLKNEITIE